MKMCRERHGNINFVRRDFSNRTNQIFCFQALISVVILHRSLLKHNIIRLVESGPREKDTRSGCSFGATKLCKRLLTDSMLPVRNETCSQIGCLSSSQTGFMAF